MALTAKIRWIAMAVAAVLLVISVRQASAQPSSDPAIAQIDLMKWALTQGGILVALLVVLWSYRRDFHTVLKHQATEIVALKDIITDASVAMTAMSAGMQALQRDADNDRRHHGDRRHER